MSTYRELVYLVSDLVKIASDDSIINESHIMCLLNKYRTYLLKQKYEKAPGAAIPASCFQTICADLIEVPMLPGCSDGCVCSAQQELYLRTEKKVPTITNLGEVKVTGSNIFRDTFTVVSPQRMEYVGYNKWLKNVIYGTVAYDNYMYFKSLNEAFKEIHKVHITAIFDDPLAASALQYCNGEEGQEGCPAIPCDELDREFPFEDALVTQLLSLVLREILGAAWRPKDSQNNANDDLASIAAFVRQNMKKDFNDTTE